MLFFPSLKRSLLHHCDLSTNKLSKQNSFVMDKNGNQKKRHRFRKARETITTDDSGRGDSETTSTSLTPVEAMTSRDFHLDYNAHVEMINQMLKDTVRINTFKAAILHNKHLFKGKRVLNIGCGSGIYALFAAKAGAAKVFAVDSSNVACYAKQIVEANGYSEVIKVIQGEIDEIELPVAEVDIIVCDWMGYALLFQSICDTVIFARDKWLKKPDGLIFPDQGKLYMVALEDTKHKSANIDWWSDVYGFNMRCLRQVALIEPRCQTIRPDQIISKQFPIKTVNLNTATIEDLNFRSKFMLPIQKTGHMDAIALYFHVYFTKSHTPLGFSTDPWSPRTNWLQTILFLDQSLSVNAGSLYYGGIEFTSLNKPINLNDIIVNFEMFMGDPTQVDLEVDMSWHFKLTTAATAAASQKKSNKNKNAAGITTERIINKKTDSKIQETLIVSNKRNANKGSFKNQNTIKCSGLVVTTDNVNNTITNGKHNYPCRKYKRNKIKCPKNV